MTTPQVVSRARSRTLMKEVICRVLSQQAPPGWTCQPNRTQKPLCLSALCRGEWPHKAPKVIIVSFLGLPCQYMIPADFEIASTHKEQTI
jgi:hypothetical protein